MSDFLSLAIFFFFNSASFLLALYANEWLKQPRKQTGIIPMSGPAAPSDGELAKECRACAQMIPAKAKRCPWCTSSV